jgi:hypothetical protein
MDHKHQKQSGLALNFIIYYALNLLLLTFSADPTWFRQIQFQFMFILPVRLIGNHVMEFN